jgi:energy-coupling factor transport system substrate-specific component
MSWSLASFTILALALGAGFAWYERTHPTSKVLALVATLAALAALGRVAFAPLPSIKPTTDIVLLSGFALGGAPGFAVGAIAALASNVFFGQGPWTPWQMAAWGLVGILGAALAVASRGQARRVPIAIACGAAGLVYGAILDFSTWTQFTGEHTLGQYLAISGTALPFNVAHVVGNVVFALAFGPAFVRALKRFRARFEVRWQPLAAAATTTSAILAALAIVLAAAPVPPAAQARASTTARSIAFLRAAQNPDGGWGAAKGQRSAQLQSGWAAMGLAANGRACGSRARRYLVNGARRLTGTGDIERGILALRACGADAGALVARLRRQVRKDGSVAGLVNQTAFAILALRAAGTNTGSRVIRRAAAFVARQQNRDGGFGFGRRGSQSGVDDTAGALQALAAAHRRAPIARAIRFIRRNQNRDGGFPLVPGGGSNAQSTAWAIQAFVAAHENLDRVRTHGSRAPMTYLRSLVAPDGGVRYSRTSTQSPIWVTAQALTAFSHRAFPILR